SVSEGNKDVGSGRRSALLTRIDFSGMPAGTTSGWLLEFKPQAELPGAVAAVLRGLRALHYTKRRRRHIRRRGREVRMVEEIGESAFESEAHPLGEMKCLRKSGGDGGRARTFENTNAAVSNRA